MYPNFISCHTKFEQISIVNYIHNKDLLPFLFPMIINIKKSNTFLNYIDWEISSKNTPFGCKPNKLRETQVGSVMNGFFGTQTNPQRMFVSNLKGIGEILNHHYICVAIHMWIKFWKTTYSEFFWGSGSLFFSWSRVWILLWW